MIEWTIQGTVPQLTGVTVVEGSSSSSFDYNISGTDAGGTIVGQTDSATASGLTTYTFASLTSVAALGTTTTWSSSSSETSTGAGSISNTGIEYDENGDPQTTQTLSTGSFGGGNSASSSFSATSQSTAQIQTSTTETFEQIYEVTTVITEGGPFDSIWTTSTNTYGVDKTSTVFYQTAGTQTTSLGTTFSTTTETIDTITYLDQTITLTALPDTVIQANTKKAQLAEVIYKITQTISNVTAFSAATEAAVSGTRLTISPSFRTEAKVAADSTRPTSSIELIESTSLFVITNSRTTSLNATTAQYVSFPPVTETLTVAGLTTTQSTLGTNYLDFQIDDTHGGTTSTVTVRDFAIYSTVVTRRVGTLTFHAAAESVSTYTVIQTIQAAQTESYSDSEAGSYGITINFAQGPVNTEFATYTSSGVTANTVLPTVQAAIGMGGQAQQIKYGTSGADVQGLIGGYITANATSAGNVVFSDLYALDGGHRLAITMFPATNSHRTISGNGITWTTTTTAVSSIDGATSKKTTASASIGVGGSTQTVTFSRAISNFGGLAGAGETFVQTALPGVYKNRVDGQTTRFDGSATIVTAGQSQAVAMWQPIRAVMGIVSSTNANPLTWTEFRNSTALPPAMPPDA
jgi:hypothetical protein